MGHQLTKADYDYNMICPHEYINFNRAGSVYFVEAVPGRDISSVEKLNNHHYGSSC